MHPLLKFALDLGPLLIFWLANSAFGIYVATGIFMVAVVVAIAIGFAVERRLLPMPLFTGAMVLVFGGLTLYLNNDLFLKIKVTFIYTVFAAVLLGGLAMGRLYIKNLLGEALALPDSAWRTLTWRWAAFFLSLAVLNEFVRRGVSTGSWVLFKVWIVLPLTLVFGFSQAPFMLRHQIPDDEAPRNSGE